MSATNKAKDKAQVAKSKAKSTVGRASGDKALEAEGEGDEFKGNLEQAGEKVKDSLKS
jgi:uncharacterized protein YjbJ (UPF0337 family)